MRKYLRLFSVAWTLTRFGFPLFLDQFTVRGARPQTNRPTLVVANHATHVDPETMIMVLKEYDIRFFAASTLFPGLLMNNRETWYGKLFEKFLRENPDHSLIQRLLGKNAEAIQVMSHEERLLACDSALRLALYELLNMIPVHRSEDGLGDSKHQRENLKRLKTEAANAVRKSSRLVIFPEGEVDNQWNVAELKEGTSKLAEYMVEEYRVQCKECAAAEKPLPPEPQLMVVGIVPGEFYNTYRGSITVHIAEPIPLLEWFDAYSKKSEASVALTSRVAELMADLTVQGVPDKETLFVERLSRFYRVFERDNLVRVSAVAAEVIQKTPHFPEERAELERLLQLYIEKVETLRMPYGEELLERQVRPLMLLLALPTWLGYILHLLPVRLIGDEWKKRVEPTERFRRTEILFTVAIRRLALYYGVAGAFLVVASFFGLVSFTGIPFILLGMAGLGVLAAKLYRQVNFAVRSLFSRLIKNPDFGPLREFREFESLGYEIYSYCEAIRESTTPLVEEQEEQEVTEDPQGTGVQVSLEGELLH